MPVSDTAEKNSPVSGAAATVSQLFSTPLVRVTYPYADEVSAPLAARILERGQGCPGPVKDFGYKTETSGELTRWAGPEAQRLSRWVCAVAGRFVESLTRMSLAEAYARASRREAGATDTDTDVGGGGRPAVRVGVTRSWASVYRAGDRHEAHFHPNTALSAVYYVTAPGPCELDLLDPRPNVDYFDAGISLAGDSHRVRLLCAPGELLVFPGWLKHAVPSFRGDAVRVSVAWNLNYTSG
ncbi:putative 2OG-Fe(II) oxygenase [Streptomyces niveus]|uniref:putative 2OG-Fe(II) oxygenase n=1 Tax=Streptomyces niveus TaxID=193462 RepID=UPI00343DBF45